MPAKLAPCAGCARHVRATEPACPFCGAALPPVADAAAPEEGARLSRGQILARGLARQAKGVAVAGGVAAAAALGGGCAAYGAPPPVDSGPADMGGFDAAYGGPPVDSGPADMGGLDAAYGGPPDLGRDLGGLDAAYGGPPDLGGGG